MNQIVPTLRDNRFLDSVKQIKMIVYTINMFESVMVSLVELIEQQLHVFATMKCATTSNFMFILQNFPRNGIISRVRILL